MTVSILFGVLTWCLAAAPMLGAAPEPNTPAYPKEVGPYEIIVFEQPDFVGSFKPFQVQPNACQHSVPNLSWYKLNDNISSVLVGSKVAVKFFEHEQFSGNFCKTDSSARDINVLQDCSKVYDRGSGKPADLKGKVSSFVVFLKENRDAVGVLLEDHSGLGYNKKRSFFPVDDSCKGRTQYPWLTYNDNARALSFYPMAGSPAFGSFTVTLYEHKDYKGDWITLPGARDGWGPTMMGDGQRLPTSHDLEKYKFSGKASSLNMTTTREIPVRGPYKAEAGMPIAEAIRAAGKISPAAVTAVAGGQAQGTAGTAPQATLPSVRQPGQAVRVPGAVQPPQSGIGTQTDAAASSAQGQATLPAIRQPGQAVKAPDAAQPPQAAAGTQAGGRFNPAALVVSEFKGGWAVTDNSDPSRAIAVFRQNRKADAEKAVQVMKRYGMNEKVTVGDSGFALYLVSGKAPEGAIEGERCRVFDPQSINVEQKQIGSKQDPAKVTGSYWAITSGSQQLWAFRNDEARAREARVFIRSYGFTRLCSAGEFHYWRK